MKPILALLLTLLVLSLPAQAQLTPFTAIAEMGRGINLGNTLEPPFESDWNNGPAQEYYFDDYVAAGFQTVRIPVRWDEHTGDAPPYAVEAAWMDRVEQVVDWALARDLYVILNAHHDDWIKNGYADTGLRARFDSIWVQVAERFQDKSEKLLFEIINEPYGMTREDVDDLNPRILSIIREKNPTRLVIFCGNEWSSATTLINAAIPDPNDPYLIGYWHAYDPWNFAGLGNGTWGTDGDRQGVSNTFQRVADWTADTGIPTMISEFGAVHEADENSRMAFFAAYVEEALKHGIAFQVWDDGGMFEVYQRAARTWHPEKDILLNTYIDSPTKMNVAVVGDTLMALTWENRTTGNKDIVVERRLAGGDDVFAELAVLPADATSYDDLRPAGGQTYQYRVIARFGLGADRYGYPFEVFAPPTVRTSFLGAPFAVPGTIEAEDFDVGGEGLTYHDTDPENIPGAYRPGEGVDIEPRDDGGFQVAYVESGEWLEYTIDVETGGLYEVMAEVASLEGGGRFRFEAGEEKTGILKPPNTNSWQTTEPVTGTITLAPGEQVLRLDLLTARPFNVDRFTFVLVSATDAEQPEPDQGFALYPNPATGHLTIEAPAAGPQRIAVYDLLGRRLRDAAVAHGRHRLDVSDLPMGLYLLRLTADGLTVAQETFIKR